jgi:hypothetical protein
METFTEESEILKINHCGHVFSKPAITRWLRNHVTCPVCRHDIRGDTVQQDNELHNMDTPSVGQRPSISQPAGIGQTPALGQGPGQPQTYQMDFVFDTPEGLNSFFERVGLNSTSITNDDILLQTPSFYTLPRNSSL